MYDESVFIIITNTDGSVHEYEYVDVIEYDDRKYAVLSNCEGLRIMEKVDSPIGLKDVQYETALKVVELYRENRGSQIGGNDE